MRLWACAKPSLGASLSGRELVAQCWATENSQHLGASRTEKQMENWAASAQSKESASKVLTTFNCWHQLPSSTVGESPAKASKPARTSTPHFPSVKQRSSLGLQGTSRQKSCKDRHLEMFQRRNAPLSACCSLLLKDVLQHVQESRTGARD